MAFSSFPPTVLTVSGSRVRAKSPISAGSARHPEDVFACAEAIVANSSKNVKKEKSEGEIVIGRSPWLPLWGSWLPRKGQTERASMADFCCHYLTAAPSQSACSADSSPKGRAKGCCRICPPNYNLARKQNKKRCRIPAAHFICHRNQTARSTLLERRHLVQAYTWQGVPFTTAFTRLTLGFHSRLERLWEWETLIPKVTPLPQKSHFAIHCTSHPN